MADTIAKSFDSDFEAVKLSRSGRVEIGASFSKPMKASRVVVTKRVDGDVKFKITTRPFKATQSSTD